MSALDFKITNEPAQDGDPAPDRVLDNRGGDCASGFVKLLEVMARMPCIFPCTCTWGWARR